MNSDAISARLGLIELFTHENNLHNLCKIALGAGHDVTVFTTVETRESLETAEGLATNRINWVVRGDNESLSEFLNRTSDRATDLDLLMFTSVYGTAHKLRHFWRFNPDCPIAIWVFNINAWLGGYSGTKGIFGNVNTFARRRVLSNVDAIVVEYEPIKSYVESELTNRVINDIYCFAPTLYEGESKWTDINKNEDDALSFVVPGRIEKSRRNYDAVCDAFEAVDPAVADSLELTLLGKPYGEYGKRIVNRCNKLADRGVEITVFDEWIPIETYHRKIREATFLLCPLQPTTESVSVTEVYGRTKGSGNVWDAIQNATPLVLPLHFTIADYIESSTYSYDSKNDLTEFINQAATNPEHVASLRRNAVTNAELFSIENQCSRFDALVSDMIGE